MTKLAAMIGLGEVLWDRFPSGRQLGGAPANFAYIARVLGGEGVVASRVGRDSMGGEAIGKLREAGVETRYLQRDERHATGTVDVTVDADGQPGYKITESVAWDYLEWSEEWAELAARADVICFGTLAQRCPGSRETIRRFLDTAKAGVLRIFDVNLRQSFYSREVMQESLKRCEVVKLNHAELPLAARLVGLREGSELEQAQRLRDQYSLRLVCVTRGANGSVLVGEQDAVEHAGIAVTVADTVGAGDAFTACLAHEMLRGSSLEQIGTRANQVAAWVASQVGGMPRGSPLSLETSPLKPKRGA